jgi:phosphoadenosine phosphosulfate reductase
MLAHPHTPTALGLPAKAQRLADALHGATVRHGGGRVALASSLSAEDMVITHVIAQNRLPIRVITLDTGRLHVETAALIETASRHFNLPIEVFHPEPEAGCAYVRDHGRNAFYESVDLRKSCCVIRKVEPLNRALAGAGARITGQRREQGAARVELSDIEWDQQRAMEKLNPLAAWSWEEVLAFAADHDVPLNPLHARGYPSIGCEPCTRAIRKGEEPRAGRWWWEHSSSKECGLHLNTQSG